MNEQYLKLVKTLLPENVVNDLTANTGVEKAKVEKMAIEVVARALGDGSDLTKISIERRVKSIVKGDNLKEILVRFAEKYQVSANDASKLLTSFLPLLFQKLESLDNSYFTEEEVKKVVDPIEKFNKEVEYVGQAAPKSIEEISETKKVDPTVDDVFSNIEKKANVEYVEQNKKNLKKKKKKSKKHFSFSSIFKKNKKQIEEAPKQNPIKEDLILDEDDEKLSLLEKICMWVVLAALIALIGIVIFLVIKQKI